MTGSLSNDRALLQGETAVTEPQLRPIATAPQATTATAATKCGIFLLFLYACVGPLFFVPTTLGTVALVDFLLVPAVLVTVIRPPARKYHLLVLCYGVYQLAALVSVLLSDRVRFEDVVEAMRLAAIFVPFVVALSVRKRRVVLWGADVVVHRSVIGWFLVGGGLAIWAGLAVFFELIDIPSAGPGTRLYLGDGQGSVARAGGLYGHSGPFGLLLGFWMTIAVTGFSEIGVRTRIFVCCTAPIAVAGLYFSASRGAVVQLAAALLPFGLLWLVGKAKLRLRTVLVGLGVMGSLALFGFVRGFGSNPAMSRVLGRLDILNLTGSSGFYQSVRSESWRNMLRDEPIQVVGIGYQQFHDLRGVYVDNAYLSALIEVGIVGFIVFVAFWVLLLREFWIYRDVATARIGFALVMSCMARMMIGGANSDWSSFPAAMAITGALLVAANADWSRQQSTESAQ